MFFFTYTQGDLIIPTGQGHGVLRRDEKSEQMLDEFCRKRTDVSDLQSVSSVLNIKRVKTGPDGMAAGGPDGGGGKYHESCAVQ